MSILETAFGDFILALLQTATFRWVMALIAAFWVWLCGERESDWRWGFILAPLMAAGLVEIIDLRTAPGGWLPLFVAVKEALKHLASPLGLITILCAMALGGWRAFAFLVAMAAFTTFYVAERQVGAGQSFLSFDYVKTALSMLPAILLVQLTFYGFGASIRRFVEFRRAAR